MADKTIESDRYGCFRSPLFAVCLAGSGYILATRDGSWEVYGAALGIALILVLQVAGWACFQLLMFYLFGQSYVTMFLKGNIRSTLAGERRMGARGWAVPLLVTVIAGQTYRVAESVDPAIALAVFGQSTLELSEAATLESDLLQGFLPIDSSLIGPSYVHVSSRSDRELGVLDVKRPGSGDCSTL